MEFDSFYFYYQSTPMLNSKNCLHSLLHLSPPLSFPTWLHHVILPALLDQQSSNNRALFHDSTILWVTWRSMWLLLFTLSIFPSPQPSSYYWIELIIVLKVPNSTGQPAQSEEESSYLSTKLWPGHVLAAVLAVTFLQAMKMSSQEVY